MDFGPGNIDRNNVSARRLAIFDQSGDGAFEQALELAEKENTGFEKTRGNRDENSFRNSFQNRVPRTVLKIGCSPRRVLRPRDAPPGKDHQATAYPGR
jgi:hypothetical protein